MVHAFTKTARALGIGAVIACAGAPALAHPHVFVDGGVDFVLDDSLHLTEIRVTWRYDAFETLYMLSELGVTPTGPDGFTEAERQAVQAQLAEFPSDFDGSAHLTQNDVPVALAWPSDVDVRMAGVRMELSFTRVLDRPIQMDAAPLDLGFYERTYFFSFRLTDTPRFLGDGGACSAQMRPFEPSRMTTRMQAALARLSREETPQDQDVGALFADWMTVTCG